MCYITSDFYTFSARGNYFQQHSLPCFVLLGIKLSNVLQSKEDNIDNCRDFKLVLISQLCRAELMLLISLSKRVGTEISIG